MAYHHRIAAVILALAPAVGVPAAAAAQQLPSSPASPSPCSEVCSGGGYASGNSKTTSPTYSLPMILNIAGNPAPCSEVCSGRGYGLVSQPSRTPDDSSAYHTAKIPPAAVRVVTPAAGFHWGDAGIGAGGMLAVIVIGLGGALTLTYRRHQRTSRLVQHRTLKTSPTVVNGDLDVIGMPDHRPARDLRSG
jgi:hypothetical protein